MGRTKEQVYDEEISPLMARIIEIAKEHKIAMLASFHVPSDYNEDLQCSTVLLANDHTEGMSKTLLSNFIVATEILTKGYAALTFAVRAGGGNGEMGSEVSKPVQPPAPKRPTPRGPKAVTK